MLNDERDFFERSLSEWLTKFPGRIALVKGTELIGVFDTEEEALTEGGRRYQLQPFLVRRVQSTQTEDIPLALALGILSADPSFSTSATVLANS